MKNLATDKMALEKRYESSDPKWSKGRYLNWIEICQLVKEHVEKGLFCEFVKALEESDADKILEIAEAVRFFKTHRHPVQKDADPERQGILWLKERFGGPDDEWLTIREVADFIAGKKVKTTDDGFSSLRRKCKELGLPLASSRKITGK